MRQGHPNSPTGRVIVVGAGIAGLTAATELAAAGVECTVLERSRRPGGRIHSIEVNGCVMEAGANFLSSAYRHLPALAEHVGIQLRPTSPISAVYHQGHLHVIRATRPFSAFTSGLIPWTELPRTASGVLRSMSKRRKPEDLGDWVHLDGDVATSWGPKVLGRAFTERAMAAAFNGFYFQDLAQTSAAALGAVATYGARASKTLTIDGGLSALTDALAARLDVRVDSMVTEVHQEGKHAIVRCETGDHTADGVILAVPGVDAIRLWPEATESDRRLLETPYSHGLLVGLGLPERLPDQVLGGAYGLLIHPSEPGALSAISVAGRAGHGPDDADLLTCFFTDAGARAMNSAPDPDIIEAARRQVTEITGWDRWTDDHAVVRIPHAMPTTAPGRAAAVADYRARAAGPVVLAGDYLAFPWTDSAAHAGHWAAHRLMRRLAIH